MSISNVAKRRSRQDDATSQAGWMYTDLLLGLVVVFMATVSFLPSALPGLAPSAYVYTQHFDQIFEQAYPAQDADPARLSADIKIFLATNQLPESSIVEMVQVIGGYNPEVETVSAGIARAVSYANLVDARDPNIFGKAATTVDANGVLAADAVIVRLKFGAQVR